jgi:hypothetical protein
MKSRWSDLVETMIAVFLALVVIILLTFIIAFMCLYVCMGVWIFDAITYLLFGKKYIIDALLKAYRFLSQTIY